MRRVALGGGCLGFAFTLEANIDFEMAGITARLFFRGPKRLM